MKKYVIGLILLFTSSVFARDPSCVDSILIVNTALEEHINIKKIDGDFMERVVPSYLRLKDPYKLLLTQPEYDLITEETKTNKSNILSEIKENHCAYFDDLDNQIKAGRARWVKISEEIMKMSESDILKFKKVERGEKYEAFKTEEELKEYAHYLIGKFLQAEKEGKKKRTTKEILQEYVTSLKDNRRKENTQGALLTKALFLSLDPHSSYMTKDEGEEFQIAMSAQLVGVGLQLSDTALGVKITRVIPNGPADKEGTIKKGDVITKVNGSSVLKNTVNEVAKKIRGMKGTKVSLTVVREENKINVTKDVKLMRDVISLDDTRAKGKMLDVGGKKIALINLPGFYQDNKRGIGSATDILSEYNRLKKEGKVDAVVLDLRHNGGGYLDEAVKVVGIFVKEAVAVQIKTKGEVRKLRSGPAPGYIEEPLVVAINKYSASASEIVAGALKDYGRAVVVGDDRTFGKGTVQGVKSNFQSEDMGLVKITSAQFYTPDGSSTQLKGVPSDIVIPSPSNFRDIGEKNEPFAVEWNSVDSIFSKKHDSYFSKYLSTLKKNSETRVTEDKAFDDFKSQESLENMKKRMDLENEVDDEGAFKFDPTKDVVLREVLNITKDLASLLSKP